MLYLTPSCMSISPGNWDAFLYDHNTIITFNKINLNTVCSKV